MIYILVGKDFKNRNTQIKKIILSSEPIRLSMGSTSKEILSNYASSQSLFGDLSPIIIEDFLTKGDITFSKDELSILSNSKTVFIFLEDKLLLSEEKKYIKYAKIEHFEEKASKQILKINIFSIADSFARQDKIGTWMLYCEAIERGVEPEAISGIIFWKIKTMILTGSKIFSQSDLKNYSSNIVAMYHLAHRGELDFTIGLEQFILSSLNK